MYTHPRHRTPGRAHKLSLLIAAQVAAVVLLCTACGGSDSDTATSSTTTTAAPSTTHTSVAPSSAPSTSSTTAPVSGDGTTTPCASVLAGNNTRQDVYLRYGSVTCEQATAVFRRYFSDPALPREGSGGNAMFDGWGCITTSFGNLDDLGYTAGCSRSVDGAHIITVDAGQSPPPHEQDVDKFVPADAGNPDDPVYYFAAPSGKWHCAIASFGAGCSGGMPSTAAAVRSPYTGNTNMTRPNLVEIRGNQPGHFGATEDAPYYNSSARTLSYGDTLSAHGYTCSTDFTSGVTCRNAGHHFTVALDSYTLS